MASSTVKMATKKNEKELKELREVFDLFDFWDGTDDLIDAVKVGDLLRCVGLNPTNELIHKCGGTMDFGEKQYTFEDFLPIYKSIKAMKPEELGTIADFQECFKSFDREGQGFISAASLRRVLTSYGERLSDEEVDEIMRYTNTRADLDGNVKYEEFIKKVMKGPTGC